MACTEASRSRSLRASNSSPTSPSRQNTLTTFCPSIISSRYPFAAPIAACCALNPAALREVITLMIWIITTSISTISPVSSGLSTSIMIKVLTTVITLVSSWMMPWLMAWRTASTSLVNRLMISPWVRLSK